MLYKPFGYLSQFVSGQQKRKKPMLGELYDFPVGIMAIGRLDAKSEGLLLLTTDGKLSEKIRGSGVEKEYYVQVDGLITNEAIDLLRKGFEINVEGVIHQTKPCEVSRLENESNFPARKIPVRDDRHGLTSWIAITLTEGKFRQIRKMTAAVGFPTLRLVRVRVGDIYLGDLKPGEVREVNYEAANFS
jgi:23S rRNA pseudouridine2457 synthase